MIFFLKKDQEVLFSNIATLSFPSFFSNVHSFVLLRVRWNLTGLNFCSQVLFLIPRMAIFPNILHRNHIKNFIHPQQAVFQVLSTKSAQHTTIRIKATWPRCRAVELNLKSCDWNTHFLTTWPWLCHSHYGRKVRQGGRSWSVFDN